MKMKDEHYKLLNDAFKAISRDTKVYAYINAAKVANYSLTRIVWDLFRYAKVEGNSVEWQCKHLYPYMNDTHMTTALNKAYKDNLTEKTYSLYYRQWGHEEETLMLPVVYVGTLEMIESWTNHNNLKFVPSANIFGGYYVNAEQESYEVA